MIKLIRSKGVGVYFITQTPSDIPGGVLAQLSTKIEHVLRAFTPKERKALKDVAESFRENPDIDTLETLEKMGIGEALVSTLDEEGVPTVVEDAFILPPLSKMGHGDKALIEQNIKTSNLYLKYNTTSDPESAYEFLSRQNTLKEEAIEQSKEEKELKKAHDKEMKEVTRSIKSVGSTAAGTIGREIGNALGGSFGKFGKKLGGNVGASLARNLFGTLFKK